MMAIAAYLVSLPIAVALLAALFAVRDGINASWAMVRAATYTLLLLGMVWAGGKQILPWIGYAFATIIVVHVAAFYLGRWLFTGTR